MRVLWNVINVKLDGQKAPVTRDKPTSWRKEELTPST